MTGTEPCATAIISNFERFWTFLVSYEAQLLFMCAATVRAIFYYLLRSPMREARDLAYAIAATGLFGLLIAITESHPPAWAARIVEACANSGAKVAGQKRNPGTVEISTKGR